ncbi:MAG: SGNH/GDSL hydrolase family protein [Aureispira sp.]
MKLSINLLYVVALLLVLSSCRQGNLNTKTFLEKDPTALLQSVLDKDTIKIVFLGGSITGGAGASSYNNSFAAQTTKLLKEHCNVSIIPINLGIGASNSEFGLFRLQQVLQEKPDLVLIEFAVNDLGLDSLTTIAQHENIFRILLQEKIVPISLNLNMVDNQSQYPIYKSIIDYYQIPDIRVLIENQNLPDQVHPNTQAHSKIAYHILAFFKQAKLYTQTQSYPIPLPLSPHLLTEVSIANHYLPTDQWFIASQHYCLPILKCTQARDTVTFSFTGSRFGVAFPRNPSHQTQSGHLSVQIDTHPPVLISCESETDYKRINTYITEPLEVGPHNVQIITRPEPLNNGSIPTQWEIGSLLIGR